MAGIVGHQLFDEGKDVLRVKDSRAMNDRHSRHIQPGRLRISIETILVVVHGNTVANVLEYVLQLYTAYRLGVTGRYIKEYRKHLLFEELRIEPKRHEH